MSLMQKKDTANLFIKNNIGITVWR